MTISSQLAIFNTLIATGTVVVCLFAVLYTFVPKIRPHISKTLVDWVLSIASIGLILGPSIYQYYFGFPVCTMCWYQRIFMWPIGLMVLGTQFWGDNTGRRYVLSAIKWLAPAGLVFSIFHYVSQLGLTSTEALCTAGAAVSCDGIDVIVWGFMTIPMMAGIGFISLFLLLNTYSKTLKVS